MASGPHQRLSKMMAGLSSLSQLSWIPFGRRRFLSSSQMQISLLSIWRSLTLASIPPISPILTSEQLAARQVFPEGSRALQALFVHYIQEILAKPLLPIMVPLSHQRLPERSQNHFLSGMNSSHLSVPLEREQAWRAVQEQFDFLANILDKNSGADGDGVVAMGHELTYADFAIVSVLIWVEKVAPHDGWVRIRQWNGGRWGKLWERCKSCMDVF